MMGSLTGSLTGLLTLFTLTYGLGFWALIHVVGRKCHIGVSWRGAHMMGSLMGYLVGDNREFKVCGLF